MFRKLVAFILGILFLYAFSEVAMRVAAMFGGKDSTNVESSNGPPLVIIVLGESTSIPWYQGNIDISWPTKLKGYLQTHLQERGIKRKVEILNIARSGVSSTLLVDHLDEVLLTTTPDILITMTGINDTHAFPSDRGFLFTNSYVARFLYWSYISISCQGCYRLSNEFVDDAPVEKEASSALNSFFGSLVEAKLKTSSDLKMADEAFQRFKLEKSPELDIVWAQWLFRFAESPTRIQKQQHGLRMEALFLAEKYLASAKNVVVRKKGSIKQYCSVLGRLDKWHQCLDLIKSGLKAGVKLTPDFFALAISAGADRDSELKSTIESLGYTIDGNRSAISATIGSYQRLKTLQKKFGFQWFAMQYPRGSVAGLKRLIATDAASSTQDSGISGYSQIFNSKLSAASADAMDEQPLGVGIHLVSNENFNTVVGVDNEADYFFDLFARRLGANFGHTTEKGHELIARNALAAVVEQFDFGHGK